MKRTFGLFCVVPLAFLQIMAQTQPASPDPALTLKSTVRRVIVDVVVTDKDGQPVTGLSESDFQVFEDGKPQQIRSFEAHNSSDGSGAAVPLPQNLPPNTFVGVPPAQARGPVSAILLDLNNTAFEDQVFARQQLIKFLEQKPAGTRLAVFALRGSSVQMLQGLTDDKNKLLAALDAKLAMPKIPAVLGVARWGSVESSYSAATPASAEWGSPFPGQPGIGNRTSLRGIDNWGADWDSGGTGVNDAATMYALAEIARYLADVPGRKNLIWLADDFVDFTPRVVDFDTWFQPKFVGWKDTHSWLQQKRIASDLLRDNRIAIYPIGTTGLQVNRPCIFITTRPGYSSNQAQYLGWTPDNLFPSQERGPLGYYTCDSRDKNKSNMTRIAKQTGGQATYETNGISEVIAGAASAGSSYYSLSYAPPNAAEFNGRIRSIKVALQRKGYHLAYRRDYWADDPDSLNPPGNTLRGDPLLAVMRQKITLTKGLVFTAHVEAVGEPEAATPEQVAAYEAARNEVLNQFKEQLSQKPRNHQITVNLSPGQAEQLAYSENEIIGLAKQHEAELTSKLRKGKPAFALPPAQLAQVQKYSIEYLVEAAQMNLPVDSDGKRTGHLEIGVIALDAAGKSVAGYKQEIKLAILPKQYPGFADSGYSTQLTVNIPVTATSLELGIRDVNGDSAGLVEVPLPLEQDEAEVTQ